MKFRKKPVVIEAIQFDGTDAGAKACGLEREYSKKLCRGLWAINTLEGQMEAVAGDWIITGIRGEKYPCKPDIFEATYEPVEPTP